MKAAWTNTFALAAVGIAISLVILKNLDGDRSRQLLNVSYDPTRELYADLNAQFVAKYRDETATTLTIKQSHGGSSRQARSVVDGVDADVVTLALPSDIDGLQKQGLIAEGWAKRLPHDSQPYASTIVFVVRKGNPKGIHDWPDLTRDGVSIVTPNPRTSGNGKLSLLAAWGSVIQAGGTEDQARAFLTALYAHVSSLGSGARDSANAFTLEKEGDVQLTWENEAIREAEESKGELEIVYPKVSIRAEPSVAWVDANVTRKKTATFAKAYLAFLFTPQAQETIAKYGYRPADPVVLQRHADRFPQIALFPITLLAKDWQDAGVKFFAENGVFDVIYKPKSKP